MNMEFYNGYPGHNSLFPVGGSWFITIIFALVIGTIIFMLGNALREFFQTKKEKRNPIIPVPATVVTKRTSVSGNEHTFTRYYITFQFTNGERLELEVPSKHMGMIVEGDQGILSLQGKLFVDFSNQ